MMADADRVQDLLRRIAAETRGAHDMPARLLTEAADMIEVLASRLGLLGPAVGAIRPGPARKPADPLTRHYRNQVAGSDVVSDSTVAAIAAAMVFADSSPAPASAPDPTPASAPDSGGGFDGGGGDSGGGGASGSFD